MGKNERAMFLMDLRTIQWESLYRLETCAEQCSYFYNTVMELVKKHFPWKVVTRHTNDRPWITDSFCYTIRRRQRLFHTEGKDDPEFKFYWNKANRMRTHLRSEYYKGHISELKSTKVLTPLVGLADKVCDGKMQQLVYNINEFFVSV